MVAPLSTYRLQIRATFTLFDAAEVVPYLAQLGVDAVYISPILRSTEGSDHGYDVTDPTRIDADRGGEAGWAALLDATRRYGLGIVLDIVPNHMGVGHARENFPWWETLRLGENSRFAPWFDIEWSQGLHLPLLDDEVCPDNFEIRDNVLFYDQNELPLAPDSPTDDLETCLAAQHYQLMSWREANKRLTYRRFFAVASLAGLRVEDRAVYESTHQRIFDLLADGVIGVRIDHPDGLRDPGTYLARLRERLGDRWLVVEKITAPGETLPESWPCDGTVGYDALRDISQLLINPLTTDAVTAIYRDLTGDTRNSRAHELQARREQVAGLFGSELARLQRLCPDVADAAEALGELACHFTVYRTYLESGEPADRLDEALSAAIAARPDFAPTLAALSPRLHDGTDELALRFQQLTGPVAAKGMEDMACYRYNRLIAVNEVGGDLSVLGRTVDEFHVSVTARALREPHTGTTLSTHDTKRAEDVRARLAVLAELPDEWIAFATAFLDHSQISDRPLAYLVAQTLVGVGPIAHDRLHSYITKAMREAGSSTTWLAVDEEFELTVWRAIEAAYADGKLRKLWDAAVEAVDRPGKANALTQKLVQLTMPGVPDIYQGTEVWDDSLVDPDNRRCVNFTALAAMLPDTTPADWADPAYKQWLTRVALRTRREHGFAHAPYSPVTATGSAADHVVAFARGEVVTVGALHPLARKRGGGWGETALNLSAGERVDLLSGRCVISPRLADILPDAPVALLAPT